MSLDTIVLIDDDTLILDFEFATSPETIYAIATDLLETAEAVLTAAELDLPGHRFVSWHYPSWDCCDHLVVHFHIIQPDRATFRQQRKTASPTMLEVELVVTLIGCATIGDPIPTDAAIAANAEFMYTRAWTLYQGLICAWTADALADSGFSDACKSIRVGSLKPHPPQGGCESFEITFTLQLS